MHDAIYTRQSVEKVDSISIESQIEYCKYETRGNPHKEYIDRGYSGRNTNRPAFEELLADIIQGKVSRVIVYKLDRISRSILDFANMMETFQKYNVEFVSSTEKFDTSTPIGRAMLNICIVFAQLERETIQKRVTDAYESRSKRGFYMGGRIPYGFSKTDTIIDGVKTSMYVPVPEEAEQIELMYALYADPANSLGDIVAYFNKHRIRQLRDGMWNTARISDMLHNPVYVQANADVYDFFISQGVNVINPVSDFIEHNACYLYTGAGSTPGKRGDLNGKEIVLAPHQGIVSARDWLKCRLRCLSNRQSTKCNKGKNSWLVGKVKCGNCGYGLSIAKANTKWGRYFICATRLATKAQNCKGTGGTIYADVLEDYIFNAIRSKLSEFAALLKQQTTRTNPKVNECKVRMTQIDTEIEELLSKVVGANATLMQYINEKVDALDAERKHLKEEVLSLTCVQEDGLDAITNHVEQWNGASFEDRQTVVDALIKVIRIADGNIDIAWKI